MESHTSTPVSAHAAVVEAPTLKEALRQVRQRYGDEARVVRSRTVTRRLRGRLGAERVVEVLVEPAADAGNAGTRPAARSAAPEAGRSLATEIAAEVERIEQLVRQIDADHRRLAPRRPEVLASPIAEALVGAGADLDVVARLLARFAAETGRDPRDRTAVLEYLAQSLPASGGRWDDFGGCHVLLGPTGSGKTEVALAAAAILQGLGRRVLVLALLPRHGGEVRRLQIEAARHGYDAAILQKPQQLAASEEHLTDYDAVIVDTPAWDAAGFASSVELRAAISHNPSFHRHVVCPLDRDLRDSGRLVATAREWNCDWTVITRVDQVGRPGKLLDLLDLLPLPISLVGGGPELAVANPGLLTDLALQVGDAADRSRLARA